MNTGIVRVALVAPLWLFVGAACGSASEITTAPVLEPGSRFTCNSSAGAVDAPAPFKGTQLSGSRTPDDNWAELARTLPGGFAGIFLENGKLVMNFVDPEAGKAAVAEISRRSTVGPVDKTLWDHPELRAVRWDFGRLYDWKAYLYSTFPLTGMTYSDIDEKRNTLTFGFIDEVARNAFIVSMNAAKVPCNLVLTEIRAPASPASIGST